MGDFAGLIAPLGKVPFLHTNLGLGHLRTIDIKSPVPIDIGASRRIMPRGFHGPDLCRRVALFREYNFPVGRDGGPFDLLSVVRDE